MSQSTQAVMYDALQELLSYCRSCIDDPLDSNEPYVDVATRLSLILEEGGCGATTDGQAYTGIPGVLACVKLAQHSGSHASIEGAVW